MGRSEGAKIPAGSWSGNVARVAPGAGVTLSFRSRMGPTAAPPRKGPAAGATPGRGPATSARPSTQRTTSSTRRWAPMAAPSTSLVRSWVRSRPGTSIPYPSSPACVVRNRGRASDSATTSAKLRNAGTDEGAGGSARHLRALRPPPRANVMQPASAPAAVASGDDAAPSVLSEENRRLDPQHSPCRRVTGQQGHEHEAGGDSAQRRGIEGRDTDEHCTGDARREVDSRHAQE